MTDLELAWFAGLYEGEGSIFLTKPRPNSRSNGGTYLIMSIGSTDRDVVLRAQKIVGGRVVGPYNFKHRGRNYKNIKPMFYWKLSETEKVRSLALQIRPFLGIRRTEQIDTCLKNQAYAPERTLEDRFWDMVNKTDDCWLWTGFRDQYGFGTWGYAETKRTQAHRYSISLISNNPPPRVVNKCGNKHCVRPDHWVSAKGMAEIV